MSETTKADEAKARAEASFKKPLAIADLNATAVEAARIARSEKTAKLRALRLAKEQPDQITAAVRKDRRQP